MLYHMSLGFPPNLRLELPDVLDLTWSKHAIKAAQNDRYGQIHIFTKLYTKNAKIVEVETEDNYIVKIVLRVSFSETLDLCVALAVGGIVKTVWLNDKNDKHASLDVKRYSVV